MKKSYTNVFQITLLSGFFFVISIQAQTVLEANGPGDTYELINSVLAPTGGDVVESAECAHPEFGRHIAEVWDEDLQKYVFEFYIHVTPDNDRCINFDRQRVEIKTYDASPDYLKGVSGETVIYKWRFKVPTGFKPSSSFTHIHQIKAVGGDESDPLFVLTARKGNPNKLELNYYSDSNLSSQKLTQVNLSLFENTWVEVTERIKLDNVNGTYSILIKKVSDGTTILSYSNNKLLTFRANNTFIRPKWGIYRSLNTPADLRDDSLRFASFSIDKEPMISALSAKNENNNEFEIISNQIKSNVIFNYYVHNNENIKLELYNTNGMLCKILINNEKRNIGLQTEAFDLGNLQAGIYFARISTADGAYSKKLVINN